MSKGMAIVQDVTQSAISLVTLHYIHLQFDTTCNDPRKECSVSCMQQGGLLFKHLKQVGIKNHTVLDNFCPALDVYTFWKCQKKCRVHNYQLRLIKSSNQIFTQGMINTRLATDCRIHLR